MTPDVLAPQPMTRAQVADLVRRVRATQAGGVDSVGRKKRRREAAAAARASADAIIARLAGVVARRRRRSARRGAR